MLFVALVVVHALLPLRSGLRRHSSRRAVVKAETMDDVTKAAHELSKTIGSLVSSAGSSWVNGGWQVKKRAGKWLPELVSATSTLVPAKDAPERQWLGTASQGAKALASPIVPEPDREVAVATEFAKFLMRRNVQCERRSDGSILFASEAALAASVAAYTVQVTKELGAAARALARYVDDLEVELAAADEQAVRLRAEVVDTEKRADEKARLAEQALHDAERLRQSQVELERVLETTRGAASSFERRADMASQRLLQVEAEVNASAADLAAAVQNAATLEAALADAQATSVARVKEAGLAASRAEAAETLARAAARERDAIDDVAKAMEKRALAAEQAASDTAQKLADALVKTVDAEAQLTAALDRTDADDDVGRAAQQSILEARETVLPLLQTKDALPSIWKMKKKELQAELQSYGRDAGKLKVPELKAFVRVERLKRKGGASADAEDDAVVETADKDAPTTARDTAPSLDISDLAPVGPDSDVEAPPPPAPEAPEARTPHIPSVAPAATTKAPTEPREAKIPAMTLPVFDDDDADPAAPQEIRG